MTKVTDWIGIALGVVGIITVIVGVWTCCLTVRKSRAAQDVGSVCLQKRAMGLFTANEPWGWWMGREVRILEVPTLYGVLRAGEANKWTSTLVEGIYDNLDDEVCWKRLYEQFFIQLAWQEPSVLKEPRLSRIMQRALKIIRIDKKRARKTPRMLELEARADNAVHWWARLGLYTLDCWTACLRLFSRKTYIYHRSHDRRLLYKLIQNRVPLLQDCVRTLEQVHAVAVEEGDPLRGYESIWDRHLRPIWIIKKRPCLPVSREQLLGFCLAFAINLTLEHGNNFHGSGAYGLTVDVSNQKDYLRIKLQHPRRGPRLQAAKGNGYSTLFAKLMACGCLPFARTPGLTKSIEVNSEIHNAIQQGLSIKDDAEVYPNSSSVSFLGELPGQTNDDYYYKAGLQTDTPGCICDHHNIPLGGVDNADRFTWAKAVSGIAFGGLVPQAARKLVSAVRFTVLGTDVIGGTPIELLDDIERLVNCVHGWNNEYELFGTYIARRQAATNASGNSTFAIDPCGIADATAIFSRYATLLERFLGISAEKTCTTIDYKDTVYESLSTILTTSYTSAVAAAKAAANAAEGRAEQAEGAEGQAAAKAAERRAGQAEGAEGQADGEAPEAMAAREGGLPLVGLRNRLSLLNNFQSRSLPLNPNASQRRQFEHDLLESCAMLARILLLAWTYQVNLVCWDEDEPSFSSIAEKRAVRLLSVASIPDQLGALGL